MTVSWVQTGRPRRLVVNADDFGRSPSINQAVIRAHTEGILTTASLMVNEPAADAAVALAHEHPTLGVGLHLSLLCGRAGLSADQIPGLVGQDGCFTDNPVEAGMSYFFVRALREQLRAEIREQLRRFQATGLELDHVNGHLHLHLHPTVLQLLLDEVVAYGIRRVRFTHDPWRLNLRLAGGRHFYRASHALIYRILSGRARRRFAELHLRHTDYCFGLLQNARVDEAYIRKLLPKLPGGDSELYSHPSLDEFRHEFEALISPEVKDDVERLGLQLVRYQDL